MNQTIYILGIHILPVDLDRAYLESIRYISDKKQGFFVLANIHLIMEAMNRNELRSAINQSAATFPDGKGLVMGLWMQGARVGQKVRGADLMLKICRYAADHGLKIFLYGSTKDTLGKLEKKLVHLFPRIHIVGAIHPPFGPMSQEQEGRYVDEINASNAEILFVALGAPKQEKWMADHTKRLRAVQFGVGAAFDFIAGNLSQAPRWMQNMPLEWLHRFPQQPKKTAFRMMLVPKFFLLAFLQRRRRLKSRVR